MIRKRHSVSLADFVKALEEEYLEMVHKLTVTNFKLAFHLKLEKKLFNKRIHFIWNIMNLLGLIKGYEVCIDWDEDETKTIAMVPFIQKNPINAKLSLIRGELFVSSIWLMGFPVNCNTLWKVWAINEICFGYRLIERTKKLVLAGQDETLYSKEYEDLVYDADLETNKICRYFKLEKNAYDLIDYLSYQDWQTPFNPTLWSRIQNLECNNEERIVCTSDN